MTADVIFSANRAPSKKTQASTLYNLHLVTVADRLPPPVVAAARAAVRKGRSRVCRNQGAIGVLFHTAVLVGPYFCAGGAPCIKFAYVVSTPCPKAHT